MYVKFFISHLLNTLPHLDQEFIDRVDDILTRPRWRLHSELNAQDISLIRSSREHNITKLFLGPQLIEERLV